MFVVLTVLIAAADQICLQLTVAVYSSLQLSTAHQACPQLDIPFCRLRDVSPAKHVFA